MKIVFGPISIENFVDSTIDFFECVNEKYVKIFVLIVSQVKYGKYAKYWKKLVAVLNFCFEDDFQFKKYHKYAKSPLNEGGPR